MRDRTVQLITSLDAGIDPEDVRIWTVDGVPISDWERAMLHDATEAQWTEADATLALAVERRRAALTQARAELVQHQRALIVVRNTIERER
jgi:hypothetical protein